MRWDIDFLEKFGETLNTGLSQKQLDRLLREKKIDNLEVVGGNVLDTLLDYLLANPH